MNKLKQIIWPSESKMPPWVERFLEDLGSRSEESKRRFCESMENRLNLRDRFAEKYLSGFGIELGAQQVPTKTSRQAKVEYVDVISNEDLVSRYRLPEAQLVKLAHVIDGNNLSIYEDEELDFVIANHVLEHFDDPVGGLKEWMRILKNGGRLFITLPNHRANCYDMGRTPVTEQHLELDYLDFEGRSERNFQHYADFAKSLYGWTDINAIESQARTWIEAGDRHHYHVYDKSSVRSVFSLVTTHSGIGLKWIDGILDHDRFEFLVIVEKADGATLFNWPNFD